MGTCKWAKEKAQEIKCHPKALGVQQPQDAGRLKDRMKHKGQLTLKKQQQQKKKSWRAFDSSVIPVLLNSVSGCVIFGSGVVAKEVQPQGGGGVGLLEFCLA